MSDFCTLDDNGLTLKVKDYINDESHVRLLPVTHIAQESFYESIQSLADGKVLYENIGRLKNLSKEELIDFSIEDILTPFKLRINSKIALQLLAAKIFNLSFQFDSLDYKSMDLYHADITDEEAKILSMEDMVGASVEMSNYVYYSLMLLNSERLYSRGVKEPLQNFYISFLQDVYDNIIHYENKFPADFFRDDKLVRMIESMLLRNRNLDILYGASHMKEIESHLIQKGLHLQKESSFVALPAFLPR